MTTTTIYFQMHLRSLPWHDSEYRYKYNIYLAFHTHRGQSTRLVFFLLWIDLLLYFPIVFFFVSVVTIHNIHASVTLELDL